MKRGSDAIHQNAGKAASRRKSPRLPDPRYENRTYINRYRTSPVARLDPPVLRVGGIERESIVDGPGFRYVLFVQGCRFRCPGCHNAHLQTFAGGTDMTVTEALADIRSNPLLDGLTLSGGDPFTQAAACAALAEQVGNSGLSVLTFTGYRWEALLAAGREDWQRLIEASDIIVDGPFVMALRDLGLRFRGSANQRLIDVRRSLAAGRAVLSEG